MRLIDADDLVEKRYDADYWSDCQDPDWVVDWEDIENAPTIEAEPVVHGEWIHDINNLYGCSECMERETMSHKKLKPYCPNCGAKMDRGIDHDSGKSN